MDPYCKVSYGGELRKTKVAEDADKYPVWNEKFTFRISP